MCDISKLTMQSPDSLRGLSLHGSPYTPYSDELYRIDVNRHRVVVNVTTQLMRARVCRSLVYVKEPRSGFPFSGRCVKETVGDFLQKGDRLDPSPELTDISKFIDTPVPFRACFWRGTNASRLRYASPILDIEGVTLDCYGVDKMHSWVLGPCQQFVASVMHFCLLADVWDFQRFGWMNAAEVNQLGLLRIKSEMWIYYARKRSVDADFKKRVSSIWNLTLKMLGPAHNPCLGAKASETQGLVEFSGVFIFIAKRLPASPHQPWESQPHPGVPR
jgi:hypothetical protein